MDQAIITLIIAIIAIVAHIIKSMKEAAQVQQSPVQADEDDDLVLIAHPNPGRQNKPQKTYRQRLIEQQSFGDSLSISASSKRQALSKKLTPQGEGERFEVDPGTLDTGHIVAPTIDPTVKPELESITGIYEEGAVFTEKSKPAITLNVADYLAKPEGIIHAVILAEILNRPAWEEIPRKV